jgi:integrase
MAAVQPTIRVSESQPNNPTQKRPRGDGSVYKRGDFFWCSFYKNGKQLREPCHTDDEAKALKYLQRRRNQARMSEADPSKTFITRKEHKRSVSDVMEALRRHFEAEDQLSAPTACYIDKIVAAFGERRATSLTASEVNEYVADRRSAGYANASCNRLTQLLKQAFTHAKLPLPGPEPIVRLSEKGNVRQGFLSEGQIRAVIAHLPDDLADFTLFGWHTGTRRGEIALLKWTFVQDDIINVPAEVTKTEEPHIIPLVGELAELIQRRKAARRFKRDGTVTLAAHIFHRDGVPITEFRKAWHSACIKAGLARWVCPECVGAKGSEDEGKSVFELDAKSVCPRCSKRWKSEDRKYSGAIFHDLRRSACKDMIAAGVPQIHAMRISGHATNSMFLRYAIEDSNDARRALERTQAYRKTVEQKVVAMGAAGD